MSTVITHPAADAVILGIGPMGGDISVKLATAGIKTVGIERGPYWDYSIDYSHAKYDEWAIIYAHRFDGPLTQHTFTLRNDRTQFAMPVRRYLGQAHGHGYGVGGATQHYGGQMGRYGPWVHQVLSSTVSKYGQAFLDNAVPNNDIQDWPYTYNDLVPYYKDWEMAWGVNGTDQQPFHPDSKFPMPPHPATPLGQLYNDTTAAMGYHPHPIPTSLASQPFVNQFGVQVNACVYDGWCSCNAFPCEVGAKANSAYRTVPAAIKSGNLDLRTYSYVFRLDTDPVTNKVTQARYYDAAGNVHVQPGKVFINTVQAHSIIRMMLISGIGNPYNPVTVTGTLGRGAVQTGGSPSRSATGTLALGANAYPAGNGQGGAFQFLDLADDNFDHTGKDYIGGSRVTVGAYVGSGPGGLSMAQAASANNIGSAYKASLKDRYLQTTTTLSLSPSGMFPPRKTDYIDLDPHYTDMYGDPLARQTMANNNNGTKCSNDQAPLYQAILQKMGATNITLSAPADPTKPAQITSWSNHTRGGLRIGTDKTLSAMNKWGESWTAENLFAAGEGLVPVGDNTTTGGTHPVGAMAFLNADGIKKYLASPGPLV
jgi:gluconate 2-dehydrogenase alpha chain